jgi:hypothetical protein
MLLGASSAFLVACVGLLGDFDTDGSDAAVDAQYDGAGNAPPDVKVPPSHDAAVGAGEDDAQLPLDSSLPDGAQLDASDDADAALHDASAADADAALHDASEAGPHDAGPPDTGPVGAIWDQSNWNQSLWQ